MRESSNSTTTFLPYWERKRGKKSSAERSLEKARERAKMGKKPEAAIKMELDVLTHSKEAAAAASLYAEMKTDKY